MGGQGNLVLQLEGRLSHVTREFVPFPNFDEVPLFLTYINYFATN